MFYFIKVLVLIIFCFSFFGQTFDTILVQSQDNNQSNSNQSSSISQSIPQISQNSNSQESNQKSSEKNDENIANLEYQNLDLGQADGVKLRKNEAEMG